MKYRKLTKEELVPLEKEFVDFLVINGIVADDWGKMKQNDPVNAERIIEQFSDVVFEGTLRKILFVDIIQPKHLYTFQCLPEKIILRGIEADTHLDIDFTQTNNFQDFIQHPPKGISVVQSEKSYQGSREEELFKMIEKGALVSDGKWFKAICMVAS